jgi:hypothetical protein
MLQPPRSWKSGAGEGRIARGQSQDQRPFPQLNPYIAALIYANQL